MEDTIAALPPPMQLAIMHAPLPVRDRLQWLLRFDRRLMQLVARAAEPLFAQMRLAWWRESLGKDALDRPKGEPLLASLNEHSDDAVLLVAACALVDAAELQALGEEQDARVKRAVAIAQAFAGWTGSDKEVAEKLALVWAGQSDDSLTSFARSFRPLTILAMAERAEEQRKGQGGLVTGLRLSWHALTGR